MTTESTPRQGGILGSLKDALAAASREDTGRPPKEVGKSVIALPAADASSANGDAAVAEAAPQVSAEPAAEAALSPSAAEAAQQVRASARLEGRHVEMDSPPTTRVVRGGGLVAATAETESEDDGPARTTLVRGRAQVARGAFEQDPVVGWLVVVGGPGIGQYRPVFEGNNTIGRGTGNRISLDFGDDAISSDEQAYIRYDSAERTFLFVPNLAKTNIVSVNDKRPTGAVELSQMDVIVMGRTQVVFVPFCGPEFDWAVLAEQTRD